MHLKSSAIGYLAFDPELGQTQTNNEHDKGRTWSDQGVLWDYTLSFSGAMPCKGSIRAQTKEEAIKFLMARHFNGEDRNGVGTKDVVVHGKSQTKRIKK